MSISDMDGNELLEAGYLREKRGNEPIWAVYKFRRGSHVGERVTDDMTLHSARREEARKRDECAHDPDYVFKLCCCHHSPRPRMPQKRNARKR
jgi:hypothetical protein